MSNHDEAVEDIKKAKEALDSINYNQIKKSGHPDPKKHKYISFAKSGIRIIGALVLISGDLLMAGVCLALAEVLGIVEELV